MEPERTREWVVVLVLALVTACTGSSDSSGRSDPNGEQRATDTIEELVGDIVEADEVGAYDDVRALLVVVDGEPVVEHYVGGSPDTTGNVASVTKSVMSILIGIALDEGHLSSVDQTLGELLPDDAALMSSEMAGVTLHQVLTMTSGLPGDDARPAVAPDDDVAATLTAALTAAPGERFDFSSRGSHLLSAILVEATGRPTLDYAREKLFDPLDMPTQPAAEPLAVPQNIAAYEAAGFAWPVDSRGLHLGDSLLKLAPADMVKIGQLMLDGGRWEARSIVSERWVELSTSPLVRTAGSIRNSQEYGYQWWVTTADGLPAYAAVGLGGQVIEVVPELDLVVVVSTAIPEVPRVQGATFLALVDQLIAPALRR